MRVWAFCIATALMCSAAPAAADTIDCGSPLRLQCLTSHMFALARELPDDHPERRKAAFAEEKLAPGSMDVALRYLVSDNPDPPPWEDIAWIARAGRFDPALDLARGADAPVRRLGGMIAVAQQLAEAGALSRAASVLDEAEPMLSSASDDPDYAPILAAYAAQIRAQIGQTRNAARLLHGADISAIDALLRLASKYPVGAARLRRQAWARAEHATAPYVWLRLLQDAVERGDATAAAQAGRRALEAISPYGARTAIVAATSLLKIGLREEASRAVDPWQAWATKVQGGQRANLVNSVVPVLAALGRDADVETAIQMVTGFFHRSGAFGNAAEHLFRLGRPALAKTFEAEALAVADSTPDDTPKLRWEHDSALQNLALQRAGRGDVAGALALVEKIRDVAQRRDAIFDAVKNARASDPRPAAMAVLERLKQTAVDEGDANLLVKVATEMHRLGDASEARMALAQALTRQGGAPDGKFDMSAAAGLVWSLDGNAAAVFTALAGLDVTERQRSALRSTVIDLLTPLAPEEAVTLAAAIPEPDKRFSALERIATALVEAADK